MFAIRLKSNFSVEDMAEFLEGGVIVLLSCEKYTPNTNIEYGCTSRNMLTVFINTVFQDDELEAFSLERVIYEFHHEVVVPQKAILPVAMNAPLFNCFIGYGDNVTYVRSLGRTAMRLFIEGNIAAWDGVDTSYAVIDQTRQERFQR